jgi:hypothetical protein
MDPVYSRDECIAAIRDYYDFLAQMFVDPAYIIEPPKDGWPNISPETTKTLEKTPEVTELLRHLPYIRNRPHSNHPEGLPGATFIDWTYVVERLEGGGAHPENELLESEGTDDQFGGKIPSYCIGLVHGGYLMGDGDKEPDVILLDTTSGVVYWMNCPAGVEQSASPKSSYLVHPYPFEGEESIQGSSESSEDSSSPSLPSTYPPSPPYSAADDHEDEDGGSDGDEYDDDDDDDDDDHNGELKWGPCWPVRHFFEMLKNQFRALNFIPKSEFDVVDIWTRATGRHTTIPEDFTDDLQKVYRKYGWPDVGKYRKEECLAEVKRELEEKYPGHHGYYDRCGV